MDRPTALYRMSDLGWRNVRAGALVTLADGLSAWAAAM